jgi:toxin CptA
MSYLLAIFLSFFLGLVIQRGGTCTVAAIHEIIHKGTANRIKALIETALWVLAGELILFHLGFSIPIVNNWQIGFATILGAFLLGLGAYINGACAVGTIARIGNHEWNFLAMIPGFFCGAALINWLHLPSLEPITLGTYALPKIDSWLLILIIGLILGRGIIFYQKGFHPYVLTVMIGIFFLGLIVIDKTWSYTDLIIDLSKLKNQDLGFRIILFVSLLTGATLSGKYQEKKEPSLKFLPPNLLKRFIGGMMMGAATLIFPGSQDTLILLYMPMLLGYAWLGFVLMACTILMCKLIQKRLEVK